MGVAKAVGWLRWWLLWRTNRRFTRHLFGGHNISVKNGKCQIAIAER